MVDRATLDIGTTLGGRYELSEQIGEGGFGKVFRARQLNMDRDVAVKILPPQFASMENMVERFRREARLASKLRHPNTITIHDYGQHEGAFFIVMEYLDGIDLAERLTQAKRLSMEPAIHIASQSLRSLQEAHDFGIVHRDLKPENVFLIRMSGEADFVKILDFGIAKLAEPAAADSTGERGRQLTVQGSTVGTPCYMSPEQAAGESVDVQSDIYTMGIILYEMINGHPPFMDERPVRIMRAHLFDPLPSFSNKELRNSRLESVVRKAMEKDPQHRFQSSNEFLQALAEPGLEKPSMGFLQLPFSKTSESTSEIEDRSHTPRSRTESGADDIPFDTIPRHREEIPPSGFSQQSDSVTSSIITVLDPPDEEDVIVLTDLKERPEPSPTSEAADTEEFSDKPSILEEPEESISHQASASRSNNEWSWDEELTATDASGSQLLQDFQPDGRRRSILLLSIVLICAIILFVVLVASGWVPLGW